MNIVYTSPPQHDKPCSTSASAITLINTALKNDSMNNDSTRFHSVMTKWW